MKAQNKLQRNHYPLNEYVHKEPKIHWIYALDCQINSHSAKAMNFFKKPNQFSSRNKNKNNKMKLLWHNVLGTPKKSSQ